MIHITTDILKKTNSKMNLVAIPTETVYGLAGNIYRKIQKIFETKKRPYLIP
jgi:L-threonylcarbamoyladenylate synthase